MEKIAGPYLHTLAGILGDKRSTMLESELQYKVGNLVYNNNNNNTLIYIAPACRMTSEAQIYYLLLWHTFPYRSIHTVLRLNDVWFYFGRKHTENYVQMKNAFPSSCNRTCITRSLRRQRVRPSVCHTQVLCLAERKQDREIIIIIIIIRIRNICSAPFTDKIRTAVHYIVSKKQ